jgi:hypothetical protein
MGTLNQTGIGTNVSRTKTHKNLTFQEALIAIAVYAAQIDPDESNHDIKRIVDIAKKNPLFKEEPKELQARIKESVNSMRIGDPLDIVEIAANSLPSEYKRIAFKWASELILDQGQPSEEKKEILDWIRVKLSIESKAAKRFIAE